MADLTDPRQPIVSLHRSDTIASIVGSLSRPRLLALAPAAKPDCAGKSAARTQPARVGDGARSVSGQEEMRKLL
jgi:hypothetical protein